MIGQTTEVTQDGPPPNTTRSIRYLSLAWINTMAAEIAASQPIRDVARHHTVSVTQVVSGGPEGEVIYNLVVADGEARFGPGAADPEDVRMEQSWETAVAVATGELNAQDAFINGHVRLYGDHQKLLDSQPVFGALSTAFKNVGERTRYE